MEQRFEDHMSDADALMWNIEKDPLLRSTIVAVLTLDRSPVWPVLRDRIERATWFIPRMRQRVVTPLLRLGPPHWSADSDFDLSYHVRRVCAPVPGDFDSVLELARTAAMAGFDRARPLWEFTLIEGLAGGQAAMLVKVHHSMTDGVGGLKILMMLLDLERTPSPGRSPEPPPEPLEELTPLSLVGPALDHRRRRALGIARRAVTGTWREAGRVIADPVGTTAGAVRVVRSVAEYLAPATTPHSPIMRERTLARGLAAFDVPLDQLKGAARSCGSSLNDAFVAGVVGGLARYHQFHGEPVDDLRMVMPINVRVEGDSLGGNHFTPARFLVPIGVKDPADRIAAVGERCRWIRDEPAVSLTDPLAAILNQLPTALTTSFFGAMLKGGDFVTSNVPGAPVPVYLAGARLERMYGFSPLSGTAANVTLVSHCGTCCVGVNTDAVAIPDLERFVEDLDGGFAEILALA
ncbi:MAG TPA: wax ester/triacylglycerol synthase family O-acyltransferase [Acidimicrobiia bacterium]|nr:wax ester/triacylglycerol synthase family O-acyltransferase [Acidimicrobiia bacterium]